jgi:D-amino-acid dehydrogenase
MDINTSHADHCFKKHFAECVASQPNFVLKTIHLHTRTHSSSGSGVIGTTHGVLPGPRRPRGEVIERQPGPGLETSYANAGEVSPGYSAPWAGPGVPLKAVKWLLMHHSPLVIKPMLDWAMWRWGLAMLRNCTEARYRINKGRMVRLAEYSRDCMKRCAPTPASLRRAHAGHAATVSHPEAARRHGQGHRDPQRIRRALRTAGPRRLPAIRAGAGRVSDKFVGALRLPGDETGDCFKFTNALAGNGQGPGRAVPLSAWTSRPRAHGRASAACAPARAW